LYEASVAGIHRPVPPTDQRTDQQLITAINDGDEAAFAALYERHKQWVVNLACRFGVDRDEALDVLQDTFSYLLSKIPIRLTAKLTTFLYPAVRHRAMELRRKRRPGVGEAYLADVAADEPKLDELRQLIRRLPVGQQEVLVMRFIDELSLEEIAAALSIPLGTVKSRLHNAISALRKDPTIQGYFE
jgi:RNA polymerase sigma-70 factor, ECF subfamily